MKLTRKISKAWGKGVDAAWLVVSPKRAKVRHHFRRLDSDADYRDAWMLGMRARGYRAAGKSGSKTPWLGDDSSADAEILLSLPKLRSRSRELNRDDPIGSGLTQSFVNNVIGTGLRAQARTKKPAKNEALEAVWKSRKDTLSLADQLGHGEAQRMIIRKVFEDGEIFRKITVREAGEPIWFETVEAERVATPMEFIADPHFRQGVERDDASVPVAYWILNQHPGDTITVGTHQTSEFQRIPAESVRHIRMIERPGQTRGVPAFHAILQDIRDLDLLLIAALKRTQIAACLAVFINSPEETDQMIDVTAEKYGYSLDQSLEPGMIWKLKPGEGIETLIPNFPTPELEAFIIMVCRRIGAALGVSWQVVLKDFSKSTYSSARTDLLETRQVYIVLQSFIIEKYLNWEWQVVMEDAILRGDERLAGITSDDILAVGWIGNGWKWIDPVKEAKGAQIELEMGTTTLRDQCAMRGTDWEEIQDQRLREELREMKERERLGLPPKGVDPNEPNEPDEPDDPDDDDDNGRNNSNGRQE